MKIIENQNLKNYTTIKIGGLARKLYFPENEKELIELVNSLPDYKIIGAGSNLLINDCKTFNHIIHTKELNKKLTISEDKIITVGCSISIQKLINYINDHNLGGIEYLYSVPGFIGGAIYMNAGRGKSFNKTISDYIISVRVLHKGKIIDLKKEECNFSHRYSIFQNDEYVILEAKFKFEEIEKNEAIKIRKERIKYSKEQQDIQYPNFGTVFCSCNKYLLLISRLSFKLSNDGLQFSKKSFNWFINKKDGTFEQAVKRIKRTEKLHKLFRKDFRVEVKIWE